MNKRIILKEVCKGLITRIPGWQIVAGKRSGGGTASADYCYTVWLKHITLLHANGLERVPKSMAELGPGNTLGVGLAAMLCGVDHYYALDVIPYASNDHDLVVLDELVEMLRARAPRPLKGWPDFDEHLDDKLFPADILSDEVLDVALAPQRVEKIRQALRGRQSDGITIRYCAPWMDDSVIEPNVIELALSHSVLEHVQDLPATYAALYRWLTTGGLMSHQIDFTAHALATTWDGYRAYSERLWSLIIGARPYLINRSTASEHMAHLRRCGFEVVCEYAQMRDDVLERARLAPPYKDISEDDRHCCSVFVQLKKG